MKSSSGRKTARKVAEAYLWGAVHATTRPDDPGLLARYVMTVANGIAVQAANGVGRRELQRLADMALRHWPLL